MPPIACSFCNKSDSAPTIKCDGCNKDVHVSCARLDADDAQRITRQRARGVRYFCGRCSSTDRLAEIRAMLGDISNRLAALEKRAPSPATDFFETVAAEVSDRMRRERNIMIFGMPERQSATDKNQVEEVLNMIKSPGNVVVAAEDIRRVGKRTAADVAANKHRPIKVTLRSRSDVISILRNKAKLRGVARFNSVSLKGDETPRQRDLLKRCRDQLKERMDRGEVDLTIKYVNGSPAVIQKNQNPTEN